MRKENEGLLQDYLICSDSMECPLCGKTHEVELRRRKTKTIVKKEIVEYEEEYYRCENCNDEENEFVTANLNRKNLLNARNAYRRLKQLLTSDEIIAIREEYGLSQLDLALLLDWGEVTISRYESKAIQDEAYDNILRSIKKDPLLAYEYLEKNKAKFSREKYDLIKKSIDENLDEYGKEYLSRKLLESNYVRYSDPSDMNGYKILSIDVLECVISYFAKRVSNLYKVKLMKMLWYADALCYKRYGYAITGLVYQHYDMGALPIGHRAIMDLNNVKVVSEDGYDYTKYHVLPNETLNLSVISAEELDILDQVIKQFKDVIAQDIVDYMHEEEAYSLTNYGEVIPFSLAKKIRDFQQ